MERDNAARRRKGISLLATTGAVSDTRQPTIANLEDFERRWPVGVAYGVALVFDAAIVALIFWLFGWI